MPVKSNNKTSGWGEFLTQAKVDTILGAVLLVLAPFGVWKLVELVTWHLQ